MKPPSGYLIRLECHLEAQLLQASNRPALGGFKRFLFCMLRSQFPIALLFPEQMIDNDQNTMSQGHKGFLVPHALAESLIIGSQKGAEARVQPLVRLQ